MLQQLSLAAQYSAASYCTNNTNSTETKLTCDTEICPMVEKADTKTLYNFYQCVLPITSSKDMAHKA